MHQEKVQQEKLKAVKARLNFEEVSQHSELGTPNRRKDLSKRLGSKHICSVFGSLRPRRGRSESPRKRDPERKTMFKRLEKGVFHKLGDKEKKEQNLLLRNIITKEHPHAGQKRYQKVKTVHEDTGSQGQKSKDQALRVTIYPNHGYDPEDHLKIFQAAANLERWAMPTWCHMFNSTLTGSARVWFDDLPTESVDSYDDLKEAFLANFLQQKKYIKDPMEIHHIKQRKRESTEDFVRRGEVAPGNQERKKSLPPWKQQEAGHKQNFKKGEILALEKGKFKAPPPMTTPVEKRNSNKIYEFHGEVGHNTDECMHLKRQIEEMLKNRKPSHPWHKVARQRITQSFSPNPEISFPPLEEEEGTEGLMIIKAEFGGHFIHRMYMDGKVQWRNHIAVGANITAGEDWRRGTFNLGLDEFCDSKIIISIKRNHWKTRS
ncbi:reverse transcriptase domain-containing protein [Tanacetum coccineum]